MKYFSLVYWGKQISSPYADGLSYDAHDTSKQAINIVKRLKREGLGCEGKIFPLEVDVKKLFEEGDIVKIPYFDDHLVLVGKDCTAFESGKVTKAQQAELLKLNPSQQLRYLRKFSSRAKQNLKKIFKSDGTRNPTLAILPGVGEYVAEMFEHVRADTYKVKSNHLVHSLDLGTYSQQRGREKQFAQLHMLGCEDELLTDVVARIGHESINRISVKLAHRSHIRIEIVKDVADKDGSKSELAALLAMAAGMEMQNNGGF